MFGKMPTVLVAGDVVTRGRIEKVYRQLYRTFFDDDKVTRSEETEYGKVGVFRVLRNKLAWGILSRLILSENIPWRRYTNHTTALK